MALRPFLAAPLATLALIGSALPAPLLAAPQTRRAARLPAGRAQAAVADAAPTVTSPTSILEVATGRGRLVTLSAPMTDVFVADDTIADVQVRSPTQIYIFGKKTGETTISATAKNGRTVFSTIVRIGTNFDSIGQMLKVAMPEANITATTMNGVVLLTGTVSSPDDVNQAEQLVTAFVGKDVRVLTRLKTAVPLQVNLQVRFAEVSRSFLKEIGVNNITRDTSNGFKFGLSSGTRTPGTIDYASTAGYPSLDASSQFGLPAGTLMLPFNPSTGKFIYPNTGTEFGFTKGAANTTLGLAGHLLGLDVLSALDLGERIGQVTTLTNPNVTALSGQTGSMLAGGEIPIPLAGGLGTVSIEYKQYGVSLSYTPTVLSDGRISLHVKPEVSQLDYSNAIITGGTRVPGLTTRRAETTVELGSGQSFMIAGLMTNSHNNTIEKTPGAGDLPVIGALFRSNGFQRNETELVVVITPYLVKPVNDGDIKLPTDGYKTPDDFERVLLGQLNGVKAGGERPKPTMVTPAGAAPTLGVTAPAETPAAPPAQQPQAVAPQPPAPIAQSKKKGAPAPGFSLN